jgi:dipeptidyl aminopeptidase/acylaminoacyl peptidase
MAAGGRRFVQLGADRTLARAPLGGGSAPREVLDNVLDVDWAPDGHSLAIARDAGDKRRLEFPPGKLLFETSGWISDVRVSPGGDKVAFTDHPERGDNTGAIVVSDRAGERKTLVARAANGLAWSPDGREILTAVGVAIDLAGRVRRVLPMPGINRLHNISRDGRILFSRSTWRREIVGRAPGARQERNLSWLDWSYPDDLSDDGNALPRGAEHRRGRQPRFYSAPRPTARRR